MYWAFSFIDYKKGSRESGSNSNTQLKKGDEILSRQSLTVTELWLQGELITVAVKETREKGSKTTMTISKFHKTNDTHRIVFLHLHPNATDKERKTTISL